MKAEVKESQDSVVRLTSVGWEFEEYDVQQATRLIGRSPEDWLVLMVLDRSFHGAD